MAEAEGAQCRIPVISLPQTAKDISPSSLQKEEEEEEKWELEKRH